MLNFRTLIHNQLKYKTGLHKPKPLKAPDDKNLTKSNERQNIQNTRIDL